MFRKSLVGTVGVWAALLTTTGLAQENLSLTIPAARELAREAFHQGNIPLSNRIGRELIAVDPNDAIGLMVLSATEPMLNRPKQGRQAGKRAFKLADDPNLKFESAFLTSRAALKEGRYGTSQYWLRRAYHLAETDAQKDEISKAFNFVRVVSPWRAQAAFDVAPSSNLNGGSLSEYLLVDDTSTFGFLSSDARALSGTRASIQGQYSYSIARDQSRDTALTFTGYRNFNHLSDAAKTISPTASGSDFDYGLAEISVTHRRVTGKNDYLPDTFGVAFGQTWYGGETLDRTQRLTLGRSLKLSNKTSARVTGKLERRLSDRGYADQTGRALTLGFGRALPKDLHLRGSIKVTDVLSKDGNQAYIGHSASVSLAMGQPVKGVRVTADVGVAYRDYSDYSIPLATLPEGRKDQELNASLNLHINSIDYMGFQPVVSVRGRAVDSNVSRFDSETLGLSLGFRSAF